MEKNMILVYLEASEGKIAKVSLEALNAAEKYAAKEGNKIAAVVMNGGCKAEDAALYGADLLVDVAAGEYQPEVYASALAELFTANDAAALFAGSTQDGRDIAARAAAKCGASYLNDMLELNEDGWVKAIYGGALFETLVPGGKPVFSIRSGSFGKPAEVAKAIESESFVPSAVELKIKIKEAVREIGESVNLEEAEVIVSGGRGMGSKENFALLEELAELLGGVVGASRPPIEDGWVTKDRQVGQSGKIVAPKLYIACGISGSIQHTAGMSGSGFIVAINKDEDAPIFDVADIGIVGNVLDVLPLIIEEVKASKA